MLRAVLVLLAIPTICFFAILAFTHANHIRYRLSIPWFCRLQGMEPYLHTTHCRMTAPNPYASANVKPGILLIDGSPPPPLYRTDFPRLYDMQRRMIEHMLSASTYEGSIMLHFIADDVDNESSALYQLRLEVNDRDYRKELVLRETLYTGGRLGRELGKVHRKAQATVRWLLSTNQRASRRIEETIDKRPKSLLEQNIASLFPQSRGSIWAWDPDIEFRWQFYASLTSFSSMLYQNLLVLDGVPMLVVLALVRSAVVAERSGEQGKWRSREEAEASSVDLHQRP
ncbi:hypothetical protein NMY22_g7245 [Coprinellus aureogranulatus]|nr:hypothetical protein NMY22_g7245 [Coprinellus aureogranulatus]